ncbi:hypothetical protein TPB0596_00410 [Tsukamurella pulmonis]|uniref:hypothetical protein n=1 Tax=Tsukamurella pulmonis TaxID=47312 RepID=UPI001EDE45D3|nr:hypothetical protein [Tsukamurella pulmonis]BDD80278.1 hypothetical protein TPB0596_00410 [Tsukamurella pulmonis]
MTEEAFRHAAHTITRDHAAPAAVAIYSGAVAAAIRRSQVAGSAQLSPMLLDELSGDRAAHRAAVEIGPVGCLALETWVCEMWEGIEELAAEAVPPTLTDAERMYRGATIELLTEADTDTATATLAFAATLAVAFVRWNAARSDPAAGGFVSSLLEEDPVAALARDELDESTRASIAISVGNRWHLIMERVAVMETVAAIEMTA